MMIYVMNGYLMIHMEIHLYVVNMSIRVLTYEYTLQIISLLMPYFSIESICATARRFV